MQVKVIIPPTDGIMWRTPTGRAVGRNVIWHNFFLDQGTFYDTGFVLSILLYYLYDFLLGYVNGWILNSSVLCVVRREL